MLTDFPTMRARIAESNRIAAMKRNYYPIQEQATLLELWEYVPCECDNNCTCKQFGCTHHWKIKKDVTFNDFVPGFLRMFVDNIRHESISRSLKSSSQQIIGINPRVREAIPVLRNLQQNWTDVHAHAYNHHKSLICDEWNNTPVADQWVFRVRDSNIYDVKKMCILFPDICIPYDTRSRNELLRLFKNKRVSTYFDLLRELRAVSIDLLNKENASLDQYRQLDKPQDQIPFNPYKISLRRPGFDYGITYLPSYRPLSRVLDKCFYHP